MLSIQLVFVVGRLLMCLHHQEVLPVVGVGTGGDIAEVPPVALVVFVVLVETS